MDGEPDPLDDRLEADGALGLDELRDVPVVVMLGERGAGKSVALEQEHALLREEGMQAEPFLHLGRDVFDLMSASTAFGQRLHQSQGQVRHVLLDGLDEGMSDVPGLDKVLLHQLRVMEPWHREGLRLRITCRTSRWSDVLEGGLRELWPQPGQVAMMTLIPLNQHDMRHAAEQRGLDAPAFVKKITGRSLQALAQQPVTLQPLLEAQARGEKLPETVAEAYDQACRSLCTETWSQDFARRQTRPAADHLLDVARWAAAALQFSRSPALTDGEPETGEELHLDSLSGPGVPGLVPEPACHRHELLHLTESALLAPVGRRRWVFAHRGYQEHLAAQYLHARIAPAVRSQLLWTGSGLARHVLPEHREIAARLAVTDPDFFEDLLAHEPLVLLLADLPVLPAAQRQRVAQALLDAVLSDGFERLDYALLRKLDHPALAEQLRPFLTPVTHSDQLYLALWIATQCHPAGLAPDLLSVAQDTALPVRLRSFALHALEEYAKDDGTVARLRLLATDAKPDVVEAALEQLWPQHLTITEYADLLPVRQMVTYKLRYTHIQILTDYNLKEALTWAVTTLNERRPKALIALVLVAQGIRFLGQAQTRSPSPDFREVLAGQALAAVAAQPELSYPVEARTPFEYLHDSLDSAPALRRRLAEHVLRHSSSDRVLHLLLTNPDVGLFPSEDLRYWAERWPDLPPKVRRTAQPLFSSRPRPEDEPLKEAVETARQADEELREATAWWDAPPPEWQLRRQKEEEERRRGNTFDEGRFIAALDAVQAAGPDTVRAAWLAVLLDHLQRTCDGRPVEEAAPLGMVAAAPTRPLADSTLSKKLTTAARHVLATAPAHTAHRVTAWGTEWGHVPELSAAAFLPAGEWEAAAGTDTDRWAGWALALATMQTLEQDRALHSKLFEQSARHAGAAFTAVLRVCLERLETHRVAELVQFLHVHQAHDAIGLVRDWATAPGRVDAAWGAVVVTLFSLGDAAALSLLKNTVAADPSPETPTADPQRWITAAYTLLPRADLHEHWPYIRRAFDDPQLFHALTDRIASLGTGHWPAGVEGLDEADLCDLYERLCAREELSQPRPEYEPGVAFQITRRDTLHELTDALPQLIAGKGTTRAAGHLTRLAASTSRNPARLGRLARRAARQAARRHSRPLPVHELRKLAADHSLRVVADEAHLLDVVMEALDRVQQALSGPNGMAILLWNRAAAAGDAAMWPMWEEDFSDLVMGLLKIQLGGQHVILNREVQIDRPGTGGGRTDIHIQAADPSHHTEPFTVIIESKGCWNKDLPTALSEQLVDRYLRRPRTAGIFLVGFFDCDQWSSLARRRCSPRHTRQEIMHEQKQLAARHDATVRARVLDCRPPGAQTD
ncbi:hypothetical protein [Streptomyces sp. Ag109_O5-1]|uniref:hypothetical protein n=1 Tax=Streptomyces sp. Ag109_O5-1 TaxID=1938851 RepID=UPI000F4EC9AA|nr:hypothetical protein [Streptomyces sp. Ag109_O5-1]